MFGASLWIFMQFLSDTTSPPVALVSAPRMTPPSNTTPQMVSLSAKTWRAEGMLFHMPGAWELYVYLGKNAAMERAVVPVSL